MLLAGPKDRDDVGMVKAARELGLAEETSAEALVPRQLRREQLQCYASSGARLLGQIDSAHRPFPEEGLHAKAGEKSTGP